MTNPFKDSLLGRDYAVNARLLDNFAVNPGLLATSESMKNLVSSISAFEGLNTKFDFGGVAANRDMVNGLIKLDLGNSVVDAPFASSRLLDIQSSMASVMDGFTQQFRASGVMESMASLVTGVNQQYVVDLPQINIGVADAFKTHALMPDFTSQIQESMGGVFQAAESMKAFQGELGQVASMVVANSGFGTFTATDSTALFGNTKFADAMSVLVPQMPTFPDFAGLNLIADLDVDRDYLAFIEDELLADQVTAKAYRTAVTALVQRLKVPRKKARKMVIGLVWLSWFSSLMTLLLVGPAEAKAFAGAVLSASGKFNAESVANAIGNLVVKPKDDEE
ncbi:hypothetical protein ACFVX3_24695 [Rhodococcus erythropolis]|jgi:hypothetical protein